MTHDEIVPLLPPHPRAFYDDIRKKEKTDLRWHVYRERCFLSFELRVAGAEQRRIAFMPFGLSPAAEFIPHLLSIIHIPGLRGN